MDRYVVISADGHAGPPSDVYRDYLDPEFRERFDEHQRMMVELREAMGRDNSDVPGRVGGGDRRRRRAHRRVRLRRPHRHPRRRGRGRRGAVPRRRRARHRPHRLLAVRHRPRRRQQRPRARPSPAAGPTTAGSADFVAQDPVRRIGVAVIPAIIPDMDTVLDLVREAKDLGHSGHPHPDPLVRPARLPRPDLRAAVGAHRGARPRAAHPLGSRTVRHRPGPGHAADLRLRGRLVGGPTVGRADLGRHLRAPPGPEVLDGRERRLVGARPDPQDGREVGRRAQHPQVRRRLPPRAVDEAERVPRPQLLLRRVDAGRGRHRPTPPDRPRQPHVGQRPPPPRGHLPLHPLLDPRAVPATSPRTRPDGSSASPPPRSTASTSTPSLRWSTASGRPPTRCTATPTSSACPRTSETQEPTMSISEHDHHDVHRLPDAPGPAGPRRPQPPPDRAQPESRAPVPVPRPQRLVRRGRGARPRPRRDADVQRVRRGRRAVPRRRRRAAHGRRVLRAPRRPPGRRRTRRGRLHPLPVPRLALRRRHRAVQRDPLRRHGPHPEPGPRPLVSRASSATG